MYALVEDATPVSVTIVSTHVLRWVARCKARGSNTLIAMPYSEAALRLQSLYALQVEG